MTDSTTQVWRTLALIYLATNARFGPRVLRQRCQRVMVREEREAIHAVLERVPAAVATWSDGNAALEPFDVVEVRRPLGSLTDSGEGRWWAAARDCRQEIAELVVDGRYDAVYAIWPSNREITLCGWGCTMGPSAEAGGAGFSSIVSDHWASLATDPDPEQGFVHEWLHQVEATYRALGVAPEQLPSLHDADLSSCRDSTEPPYGTSYADYHNGGARTWRPWYHDYMTGLVRRPDGAGCWGLTPELWALRGTRKPPA